MPQQILSGGGGTFSRPLRRRQRGRRRGPSRLAGARHRWVSADRGAWPSGRDLGWPKPVPAYFSGDFGGTERRGTEDRARSSNAGSGAVAGGSRPGYGPGCRLRARPRPVPERTSRRSVAQREKVGAWPDLGPAASARRTAPRGRGLFLGDSRARSRCRWRMTKRSQGTLRSLGASRRPGFVPLSQGLLPPVDDCGGAGGKVGDGLLRFAAGRWVGQRAGNR